jgi:sensor histidine kinase YesM
MLKFETKQWREQLVFWLFIYLFIYDYHVGEANWIAAISGTFVEVLTYAILVYLNILLFIPYFLEKKKKIAYVFCLIATIISYVFIMRTTAWEQDFYQYGGWRNVFSMVLNTTLFLLISALYWYFKQWQIEREQQIILKNEKLEAELNFLRTQISPHFIFNTLNNIYSLALQKHENTAPMVAKLSTLMRYVLYQESEGKLSLKKEIDILKEYIELHLLRKMRSQNVDFYAEGNLNEWQITPMLLINFVENAFKHSNLDNDADAWIKINCEVDKDGQLDFEVENNSILSNSQGDIGGIGLQNVQRQLTLSYPNQHHLTINNENGIFLLKLTLQLKK